MQEDEGRRSVGEGRESARRHTERQSPSFICCGPALPLPGMNYSRAFSAAAAARRNAGVEAPRVSAGGEITGAAPRPVSSLNPPTGKSVKAQTKN